MLKDLITIDGTFGTSENEQWNFFIFDKHNDMPVIIENIGITYPNPKYSIHRRETHNYFIFEYVISGKGYLEINGKKHVLEAGDVYIIQPGQKHKYYSDKKNPFKKIWINFFSDFYKEIFKRFNLTDKNVFKKCDCLNLFEEIYAFTKISCYSDSICYQVCSLLFQIVSYIKASEQPLTKNQTAEDIRKILNASIFSNVSIEDLENKFHMSKSQIMRVFKEDYNTTPYNYLISQKIKMAKHLLKKSDLKVSEICDKLAFSDPHYFSRIFKKKTGLSPIAYRKKHTC